MFDKVFVAEGSLRIRQTDDKNLKEEIDGLEVIQIATNPRSDNDENHNELILNALIAVRNQVLVELDNKILEFIKNNYPDIKNEYVQKIRDQGIIKNQSFMTVSI